jgi:hypothetical protein
MQRPAVKHSAMNAGSAGGRKRGAQAGMLAIHQSARLRFAQDLHDDIAQDQSLADGRRQGPARHQHVGPPQIPREVDLQFGEHFTLRELHHRAGDERSSTVASEGLSQEEALAYLDLCREKALAAMAAETPESLQRPSGFSWLPFSRGEALLCNLRHVQHHTGQLSAYLRRVAEDGERWWIKTGWR